jgi:hypothetical protein
MYLLFLILLLGGVFAVIILLSTIIGIATFIEIFDVRILNLVSLVLEDGLLGGAQDDSIAVRLASAEEYLDIILTTSAGDAFQHISGGGLISIAAGLGFFSIPFFLLLFIGLVRLKDRLIVFSFAAVWLVLTTLSGPVGVPLVGILVGQIMRRATLSHAGVRKGCI